MRTKTEKLCKKFYVGSFHLAAQLCDNNPYLHRTAEEAVFAAKKRMIAEDADVAIVVQIVRVLRRDDPPISVQAVR